MNQDKKREWLGLIAKGGGELTPSAFLDNAKRKDSAFHDDYVWSQSAAAKEYYEKRTANLIMHYSTVFNTTTARQRLHGITPILPSGKPAIQKVYRNPSVIAKDEAQLNQVRAAIWSRLRRVTRDMADFRTYLPEFKEILEFLLPIVQESAVVKETVGK